MTLGAFLRRVIDEFERHSLEHRVAGSLASTHHGRPRTTLDLDVVIDGPREGVLGSAMALSVDPFYASPEAAAEAWDRRATFSVIDTDSGWKIDLICRKNRPFSREEFARRMPATIAGVPVMMASAEDTIIAKLEWARASSSERQL